MAEKVHKCNVKREQGYLYFITGGGDVARFRRGSNRTEIVCPNNGDFKKEHGWMYYLDKHGDVSRSRMKSFREWAEVRDQLEPGEESLLEGKGKS